MAKMKTTRNVVYDDDDNSTVVDPFRNWFIVERKPCPVEHERPGFKVSMCIVDVTEMLCCFE